MSPSRSTRLLQLTDPHLFGDPCGCLKGINTLNTLTAVVAAARRETPGADALIVTGDLSQDGTPASYRRFTGAIRGLARRTFVVAGNHDDPAHMGTVRRERSFFMGNWQIILLHTPVPGRIGGHLSQGELTALERALMAHPHHPALVVLHHPPVAVGAPWMDAIGLDNGADLWRVIDRHPAVRGVLFGHVHQAFDARRGAVRMLSTPSTCIQFIPHAREWGLDPVAPGYRWLDLMADGDIRTRVARIGWVPEGVRD